jgi:hypothetical protein
MGVGILRSQRIVLVVLVILAAAVLVYATEEFAGAEQLAATDKLAASAALGAGSALPGFLPLNNRFQPGNALPAPGLLPVAFLLSPLYSCASE